MQKGIILILLTILIGSSLPKPGTAQDASDSTKTDTTVTVPSIPFQIERTNIDTISLQHLTDFTPLEYPFRLGLGNLGTDSYSLLAGDDFQNGIGYRNGLQPHPYFFPDRRPVFHQVRYPVTRIEFTWGTGREQFFRVSHTQNITPNLNFAVHYRRFGSPGYYPRQETNSGDLEGSVNFKTPNGKYQLYTSFSRLRSFMHQNGGILYDSLFTQDLRDNRGAFPVNLNGATFETGSEQATLDQYYFFWKDRSSDMDTSRTDTMTYDSYFGLEHHGKFRNMARSYIDEGPISGFYSRVLLDSSKTKDLFNERVLSNSLGLTLKKTMGQDGNYLRFRVGGTFDDIRVGMMDSTAYLSSVGAYGDVIGKWGRTKVRIAGRSLLNGYGKGDLQLNGSLIREFTDPILGIEEYGVEGIYYSRKPGYTLARYRSNHFQWSRDLTDPQGTHVEGFLRNENEDQGVGVHHYFQASPVYFGYSPHPRQLDGSRTMTRFQLDKDLSFKKLGFSFTGVYQKEWNTSISRFPEWLLRGELKYSTPLFQKALFAEFGVRALYYAEFKGYDYMPATRRYFLQDEVVMGGHPFIDAFIHGKVKQVIFLLEVDHLNAGLMERDYFGAPHYPLQDLMLRIGVKWNIYN